MRSLSFFLTLTLIVFVSRLHATIIHVPGDSTTIQAGINGASNGDTVLVADGTYTGDGNRDIDFLGKAIVVMSENGPEATIIDCEATLSDPHRGFHFHNGESPSAILQGFTVKRAHYYSDPGSYGVGIYCNGSSPTIRNCIVTENIGGYGAGIFCRGGASPTISNCLVYGNEGSQGAGLKSDSSSPIVINCTITDNTAMGWGGGFDMNGGTVTFINTIIWGNDAPSYPDFRVQAGTATVTYSDIGGGWPGEGNIDADPLFIDSPSCFYLQDSSPCVDTGDSTILDACSPPGLGGDRSDMGAYGGADNCWGVACPSYELILEPTGPVSVPRGGLLEWDATILNNTASTVSGDYWRSVMFPDSTEVFIPGAFLCFSNPLSGYIFSYDNQIVNDCLFIPVNADTGTYSLIGRIGLYPGTVVDEESFEFQVTE